MKTMIKGVRKASRALRLVGAVLIITDWLVEKRVKGRTSS